MTGLESVLAVSLVLLLALVLRQRLALNQTRLRLEALEAMAEWRQEEMLLRVEEIWKAVSRSKATTTTDPPPPSR